MKNAPPLNDGEEILFDHTPSLRAFKRTALLMLALTLPVVAVFLFVFPDTFWPAVPLFVTCLVLMQERFTMGKHRAWITNQRIIQQGGRATPLKELGDPRTRFGVVSVGQANQRLRLYYANDPAKLEAAVRSAKQTKGAQSDG